MTEGVLDDPNVKLKVEDGRNVLLTDRGRGYDLITVEISSVWFAGATNVYSREFYQLARSRLRPGGVMQQWLQLHNISPREIESIIGTIRSVFPYVSCWYPGDQAMIVASLEPQIPVQDRRRLIEERVQTLIRREPEQQQKIMREILESRVTSPAGVDRMLAAVKPIINTDHNRWLEYATPRYNSSALPWEATNLTFLRSFER